MQVVPNSEVTIGDTIEFVYNGKKYTSIVTNSAVDNSFLVWIEENGQFVDISMENISERKRLKEGPWHKIICKLENTTTPEIISFKTNTVDKPIVVRGLS